MRDGKAKIEKEQLDENDGLINHINEICSFTNQNSAKEVSSTRQARQFLDEVIPLLIQFECF